MSSVFASRDRNRRDGDRFIPQRSGTNMDVSRFNLMKEPQLGVPVKGDIFSQSPKHCSRDNYQRLLWTTLVGVEQSRVLNFTGATTKIPQPHHRARKSSKEQVYQWPVTPRPKPLITDPDIILDLPNFESHICTNRMDWCRTGYMATIYSDSIYLWCKKDCDCIFNIFIEAKHALKWNNAGTYLAVAGYHSKISIWSLPRKKLVSQALCPPSSSVTAMAWDRTDKYLATGCTNGALCIWTTNLSLVNIREAATNGLVITLLFSTDNKYLCTSSEDGLVRIWHWPNLKEYLEIQYKNPVRALAFHPWRNALLAIGGSLGDGSISLWNLNNQQRICYMRPETDSFVDCLSWSPLTGELVSSHQVLSPNNEEPTTKVLVLAGLDRVVDLMTGYSGRVLYLMWNAEGTQLATASTDENLFIWNFFGNSPENFSKQALQLKKKKSARSVLDMYKGIR